MKKAAAGVTVPTLIGAGKSDDVESYLAACPEPHRTTLEKLRATIRSVVPKETTEAIAYGMPSFRYKGGLVGYAAFKAHCSLFPMSGSLVEEFADAYGFRYIIDRFGLLTGPYQMAKSDQGVIALWVAAHCHGRPLAYIGFGGSGKQVRDVLHVDDFCDLVIDQIVHFELYQGRRWNAGGGLANSVSLRETTRLCREATGQEIAISSVEATRPADLRIYVTDHARVTAVNGWRPKRDVRRCVADIAAWIGREGDSLRVAIWG